MRNIHSYKDGKISFTEAGKGRVIILLHGYLENLEIWDDFAAALASDYHVISIDLPGHGLSDCYGEMHSMEFMAGVVKDLMDFKGIRKACITGHSLGGYVALAFLELYPEYLSGYCLFHSHPFADTPEAVQKRLREIELVKAGKKDIMYPPNVTMMFAEHNRDRMAASLSRSREIAAGIPGEGIIAVLRGMIERPSRLDLMEAGRVPCLWILGKMDSYIPCEAVQKRVVLPSNAEVVVLNDSGHMGFAEEPEESEKILRRFADRLVNS